MDFSHDELAALAAALEELASGPLPFDELFDRLDRRGVTVDGDELDEEMLDELLIATDQTWTNPEDVVASTSVLLDGSVFTHRLTNSELERGVVDMTPDLAVIGTDLDVLRLASGAPIELGFPFHGEVEFDEHGSFVGPAGWLDAFGAGDLLAFRRVGDRVHIERVDDAGPGIAESAALAVAFVFHHRPGAGVEPFLFTLDALCADPSLFRSPVPPIGELVANVGLRVDGAWVGYADEPFEPPGVVTNRMQRERLALDYDFDACCRSAFDVVAAAWNTWVLRRPDEDPRPPSQEIAVALAHGLVAPAFFEYVTQQMRPTTNLHDFATALIDVDGPDAAAALFLRASNAELDGRVLDAEADLALATRTDPEYAPAVFDLAWYAADRGDAAGAIAMLQQAGVRSDYAELQFLTDMTRGRARTGRNDPCPCGSGRKYKACCLQSPKPLPIEARAGWLYHKLVVFTLRPPRRSAILGLASSVSDSDADDLPERIAELAGDPFIIDLAVFEGGAAEDFLEERGALLPADERDTLEQLCWTTRRLWEILECEPGRTMTMRDTATGEAVLVSERTASKRQRPGEYLLTRVVPVGSQHQIVGLPLLMSIRHRASVMHLLDSDPDADQFAMWYGDMLAPPIVTTRAGEPFAFCHAVVRADEKALRAVLDSQYQGSGDRWTDVVTLDGENIVRAWLELTDDGALRITAWSVPRLSRVVATLRDQIDDLEAVEIVLDEEPPGSEPTIDVTVSEEAIALLDRVMREKEEAWLDESVPALGGLTPRQAADDPTRREDLVALLRDFDRSKVRMPAGTATFDVSRLRRALGIED